MTGRAGELAEDHGYRWCEDQTARMPAGEVRRFLREAVDELEREHEWDSAYGVYRELIWRFPGESVHWRGLARLASRLGEEGEAALASERAAEIEAGSGG